MNDITIKGNLVRDPEYKMLESGFSIANFTLADNGFKQGEKTVIFWNCVAFGAVAENFCNEFMVGREYEVKGIITPNNWVDKDGNQHNNQQVQVQCYKGLRKPKSKTENKETA